MTISEQIKVLCVRSNISVAELARRMGTTPQNFNSKMKRESMIGRQAIVTSEIDNLQGIGQVTVGGQEWSARTEKDGLNLQPGTVVDIVAVSGVKLIVKVDPQMTKVIGEVPQSQN